MRVLLTQLQREVASRTVHFLVFFVIGTFLAFIIPFTYYHYMDNKDYVEVPAPLTFDRKMYHACDPAITIVKYKTQVDTEITTQTILYKVTDDGSKQQLKKYPTTKRFVNKADNIKAPLVIPFKIPCELTPGVYFWDITYSYKIRGAVHYQDAQSTLITIAPASTQLTPREEGDPKATQESPQKEGKP